MRLPEPGKIGVANLAMAILLAVSSLFALLVLITPFYDHGRIIQTSEQPATVVSVTSGKGSARYVVKLDDGGTMLLLGPKLPLYPKGTRIFVTVDMFADGSIRHKLPGQW